MLWRRPSLRATRYPRADGAGKVKILDESCEMTDWHRDRAQGAADRAAA